MTPREKHIAKIRELEDAKARTRSEMLRRDYSKAIARLKRELKIYDAYRKGEKR